MSDKRVKIIYHNSVYETEVSGSSNAGSAKSVDADMEFEDQYSVKNERVPDDKASDGEKSLTDNVEVPGVQIYSNYPSETPPTGSDYQYTSSNSNKETPNSDHGSAVEEKITMNRGMQTELQFSDIRRRIDDLVNDTMMDCTPSLKLRVRQCMKRLLTELLPEIHKVDPHFLRSELSQPTVIQEISEDSLEMQASENEPTNLIRSWEDHNLNRSDSTEEETDCIISFLNKPSYVEMFYEMAKRNVKTDVKVRIGDCIFDCHRFVVERLLEYMNLIETTDGRYEIPKDYILAGEFVEAYKSELSHPHALTNIANMMMQYERTITVDVEGKFYLCNLNVLMAYSAPFRVFGKLKLGHMKMTTREVTQKGFCLVYNWMVDENPYIKCCDLEEAFRAATVLQVQLLVNGIESVFKTLN